MDGNEVRQRRRRLKKKLEALFELQAVSSETINAAARPFNCAKCLFNPTTKKPRDSIAKLRKCYTDKWDYTEADAPAVFPIQIVKGQGTGYGFCPAKVQRDDFHAVSVFQTLNAILETNTWPDAGGINDQESFWVDLVAMFGKHRRDLEFTERYNMVAKGFSDGTGKK